MFELQHDQVSGADTETYRANGNPRDVEPNMFDLTERSGTTGPALRHPACPVMDQSGVTEKRVMWRL